MEKSSRTLSPSNKIMLFRGILEGEFEVHLVYHKNTKVKQNVVFMLEATIRFFRRVQKHLSERVTFFEMSLF